MEGSMSARPKPLRKLVWTLAVLTAVSAAGSEVLRRTAVPKARQPLPTRWMAGDGTPKPLHVAPAWAGPLRMLPAEYPSVRALLEGRPVAGRVSTRLVLVVEDSLYPSIKTKLQRFVSELGAEGWTVLVSRFLSGTPQGLRSFLRTRYREKGGLAGAVFIGDIPYVVYEMMEDWNDGNGRQYDDFPCDLYYMDVDGVWSDSLSDGSVQPNNGKYDTRSGDIGLEIWVGRLQTSNLTCLGTEAGVLNNYFEKNHLFRTGALRTKPAALVYDDDDWTTMGTGDRTNLKKVLAATAEVSAPESTTAADYKGSRLPANLEFIYTRSHGWPGGHGYYRSAKSIFDYVLCADYQTINPPALFYSLFVCSGCDYTASDYLGGVAAFNQRSGLLAYGSTKTGGIWYDDEFFDSLAAGSCFGAAFVTWFNKAQADYPGYAPPWWYGMVLVGDASLRPSVWISGVIKTAAGAALPGVTITFSAGGGKAVTDAKGYYCHPVSGGWSGTASPKKPGYGFQPASRAYKSLLTNKTGQNYKAIH
jgi:hypothetical protein